MNDDGYGTARFSYRCGPGEPLGVYCDHADPKVRISAELVNQWHEGGNDHRVRGVTVACAGSTMCPVGDVVTIDCLNRRVIYRITGSEPHLLDDEPLSYCGEWPD